MTFSTHRVKEAAKTIRGRLLETGLALTEGDRNIEYGNPRENFENIALLWNGYLNAKYGGQLVDERNFQLTPEDVAQFCVLMKVARTFIGRPKMDTYIDAAVYSAIAGELAEMARLEKEEEL